MPTNKYKGVVYERPANLSNAMCKELIDNLGGDYTFSINDVLKVLSKVSSKEILVRCDTTTKIKFSEPISSLEIVSSKMADLYEHGAE